MGRKRFGTFSLFFSSLFIFVCMRMCACVGNLFRAKALSLISRCVSWQIFTCGVRHAPLFVPNKGLFRAKQSTINGAYAFRLMKRIGCATLTPLMRKQKGHRNIKAQRWPLETAEYDSLISKKPESAAVIVCTPLLRVFYL